MTQYNKISKDYVECNSSGITKKYCITPSFLKYLGGVKGKKVLDLACGDGYYTRIIKELGATEVVGVDISEEMINLAREKEKERPLGIKYFVGDVAKLEKLGDFDIITGTFLLHYAKSKEELMKMCKGISKNLNERGRFLAINDNPNFVEAKPKKYLAEYEFPKEIKEGDQIKLSFLREGEMACSFFFYRWSKETYEDALGRNKLKEIKWLRPIISEEGKKEFEKDFWKEYLTPPTLMFISAVKE